MEAVMVFRVIALVQAANGVWWFSRAVHGVAIESAASMQVLMGVAFLVIAAESWGHGRD